MVELKGVAELEATLKKNVQLSAVRTVVIKHGAALQTKMQREADFKKGYQTGATKRSIALHYSMDGLTATVAPGTEYSPYLEYGTRFMAAQPFVGPAYNEEKPLFERDLNKLVR